MERARRMLGPERAYLLEEPGLHEQLELQHRVETEVLEPESGARYNPETTAAVGSVAFGSKNMWDGDQGRPSAGRPSTSASRAPPPHRSRPRRSRPRPPSSR